MNQADDRDAIAPSGSNRRRRAINSGEIHERIAEAITAGGGRRKVARKAKISESHLSRYMAGESMPTIDPLIGIAYATGYTIAWLACGRGPKLADSEIPGIARYSEVKDTAGGASQKPTDEASQKLTDEEEFARREAILIRAIETGLKLGGARLTAAERHRKIAEGLDLLDAALGAAGKLEVDHDAGVRRSGKISA